VSTRGGEKGSRRDPELAKQGTGTRFWRPRCENMTRERCWKLYSGRFARLARKSRELGPRFDPAESVSPTTLGRRWEGRDTAGWGQLSATERERGRRCAAGPARQRAKAEGRGGGELGLGLEGFLSFFLKKPFSKRILRTIKYKLNTINTK
jgi:hypothetical protein